MENICELRMGAGSQGGSSQGVLTLGRSENIPHKEDEEETAKCWSLLGTTPKRKPEEASLVGDVTGA